MKKIRVTKGTPLRVLIVSAYADPHIGGIEVVVGQQARTLAALGHHVTVVTSSCGADATRYERIDGYSVVRIPAWNGLEDSLGDPVSDMESECDLAARIVDGQC